MHTKFFRSTFMVFILGLIVALAPVSQTVKASPSEIDNFATTAVSCADFSTVAPGESVEGLGKVHPDLSITSSNSNVQAIFEDQFPAAYGSSAGLNGGLGILEGFSDVDKVHDYEFSFGGDKVASFFSLRMLDYGDLNKVNATEHEITLVAYDINGFVVAENTLAFTSDASFNPTSGSAGNLQESGDASANIGEPGNFVFSVYGTGIVRLELVYSNNKSGSISDPNHGFADLCFELEEQDIPEDATCVDFNTVIPGQVVEGLGVVHPYLNISSTGNAVAMAENQFPAAYGSPSGLNYGMGSLSGFSDIDKIHDYTFTFASGVSVDYFTVRMLDFGDLNKVLATEHNVKLEAFDSNGFLVSTSELSFVTDAVFNPTSSSAGNLQITGDAAASLGNPGNYAFTVAGNDIVRLEMKYSSDQGVGASDPNHGLAVLCFEPEGDTGQELDPPTAELTMLRPKTTPEVGGKFLVEYACSETAPNLVSATINGYDVVNGQEVNLVIRDHESARVVGGTLVWLFAPEFSMNVTCADDLGNEVSTTVEPDFTLP